MKSLTLFFLALALTLLSGCNTIRGVGEDIKSAGSAIERSTK